MRIFLLLCYASNAHHFNNYATKSLIIIMLIIDRVQRSPQSQHHILLAGELPTVNPTDLVKVSPAEHLKEFPGECLEVRCGKLFCIACRDELSLKKSMVKNHIYSGNKQLRFKG